MLKITKNELVGWTATTFTAIAILFLGEKVWQGWVSGLIGSSIWIIYGLKGKYRPIVGVNLILFTAQLFGLLQWLNIVHITF